MTWPKSHSRLWTQQGLTLGIPHPHPGTKPRGQHSPREGQLPLLAQLYLVEMCLINHHSCNPSFPSHGAKFNISPVNVFCNLIYLFLAVLSLSCCSGFPLVVARGATLYLWCSGFLLGWLLLLQSTGSRVRWLQ